MQGNVLCSPSLGPPPDEWVSRAGPSSTSRMGKLRKEAARRPARGLAERPEALAAEDQELLLTSRLPPPLRWCRRASVPPTPNSHTPSPGSCASPQVPRTGSKDGAQSSPAAILSQRALGACVPPVQHGGAAATPPPRLPWARGFPSPPSGGREDGPHPPDPSSPLPLLARGVTYPTCLRAAARSPHGPRRTRETKSQAARLLELF